MPVSRWVALDSASSGINGLRVKSAGLTANHRLPVYPNKGFRAGRHVSKVPTPHITEETHSRPAFAQRKWWKCIPALSRAFDCEAGFGCGLFPSQVSISRGAAPESSFRDRARHP